MNPQERWRRLFGICLIALGTTAGCNSWSEFDITPTPILLPRPETPTPEYPSAVKEHYPEIIGFLPVIGQLLTEDQKLEIITFSEKASFDYVAIMQVLRLCQTIDSETEFEAKIDGRLVSFHAKQRPERGIIFVTPQDAPFPTKLKNVPPEAGSAVSLETNQVLISALRVSSDPGIYPFHPLFGGASELLSLELIKAICHASVVVESGNEENDPLLQLFLCDTIAQVIALKQVGLSYEEYRAYLKGDPGREDLSFLAFDETSYQVIPPINRLVTVDQGLKFY